MEIDSYSAGHEFLTLSAQSWRKFLTPFTKARQQTPKKKPADSSLYCCIFHEKKLPFRFINLCFNYHATFLSEVYCRVEH
jgi:hypothetical protein